MQTLAILPEVRSGFRVLIFKMTYPSSSCMAFFALQVSSGFNDFAKCSVHFYDFIFCQSVILLSLVRWSHELGYMFFEGVYVCACVCVFPGSPFIAAQRYTKLKYKNTKIITCGKELDTTFVSFFLIFNSERRTISSCVSFQRTKVHASS